MAIGIRFRVALTCLCLLGLVAGCKREEEPISTRPERFPIPADALKVEVEGKHGGTIHYALPNDPATFNPLMARDSRSKIFAHLTAATLLEFDALKQKAVPGLVKEWQVSPDGRAVTLNLRRGLTFSDGKPFSADDVLFTFAKIYEEGSRNALKDALLIDGKPLQVSRVDSHTVKLTFPFPYAAAEFILTTIPVLPKHRFPEPGAKIEEYWNLNTAPDQIVGLGPFVFRAHQSGQRSVFRYNPYYWKTDAEGRRLPYVDEFVIDYIEERSAQLLRLQAGQLDLVYVLSPDDFLLLKQSAKNVEVHNAGPASTLTFYWFNLNTEVDPRTKKPYVSGEKKDWFTNLKFRQAVSTAISRDTIVKNVYLGQATAAWTFVPSSQTKWYPQDVRKYPYDPERARELLRQSGFSWKRQGAGETLVDSEGRPVRFELLTRTDDTLLKAAAVMQQDLEKIGIQVSIKQEEFRTVISRVMNSLTYDSVLFNLEVPIEPVDQVNVLLSNMPMHMWHPNQPKPATEWEARVDELMLKQRMTLDPQERQGVYMESQRILAEHVPFVPLVNRHILIANRSGVKNVRPTNVHPFGLWNVWELYLE